MATVDELDHQIEKIVADSKINDYIRGCLENVKTPDDLVHFFLRFTKYNRPFPAGITILAGVFYLRADLFVDKNEEVIENADRSSLIASNIFFAAEDEFAGPNRTIRSTHRAMAQAVLREAIDHAGWTVKQFNERFASETDQGMAAELKRGYRIGIVDDEAEMFRALGFHLGSERLADIEFNALNDRLQEQFPVYIKGARERVNEFGTPVYLWIDAHTENEVDHYKYSVKGAAQALDFYSGANTREGITQLIIDGFNEFVEFQRIMFEWLKTESNA